MIFDIPKFIASGCIVNGAVYKNGQNVYALNSCGRIAYGNHTVMAAAFLPFADGGSVTCGGRLNYVFNDASAD